MGIEPWLGYAPWYIAQEKGYFASHGLQVNIVQFGQDADRNTALLTGKTDVSNIDTGRLVQFAAKGQAAVPLLLEDASTGADAILSTPSLGSAQQLVGKKVAYEFGTTSDLLLHYYLLQNHLTSSSVDSVNVPAADAGTLLIAGKNEAVVTYEPYISEATSGANGGKAHVLFSSAGAPGLISDMLTANPGWLKTHATEARALIAAWDDALAYYQSDPQDAIAIMAKGVGSDPASLKGVLAGVTLYSAKQTEDLVSSGKLAKQYGSIGATLKSMGVIDSVPTLSTTADFGFLP